MGEGRRGGGLEVGGVLLTALEKDFGTALLFYIQGQLHYEKHAFLKAIDDFNQPALAIEPRYGEGCAAAAGRTTSGNSPCRAERPEEGPGRQPAGCVGCPPAA